MVYIKHLEGGYDSEPAPQLIYPEDTEDRDQKEVYTEYCNAFEHVASISQQIKEAGKLHLNEDFIVKLQEDLEKATQVKEKLHIEYQSILNSKEQDEYAVEQASKFYGKDVFN